MAVCVRCGRESAATDRFCAACGTQLDVDPARAREERQVVTVLFADLVALTSRAELLDSEDVRATLSPTTPGCGPSWSTCSTSSTTSSTGRPACRCSSSPPPGPSC